MQKNDKKDAIAIVGAGKGGTAILQTILKMPEINVKYICDSNPEAPGMKLGRLHGIECQTSLDSLCLDPELDLIFEATGNPSVYETIAAKKQPGTRVIGSEDSKIIYHLLDILRGAAVRLEEYNTALEKRVIARTSELETVNSELEKKILEREELNFKFQQINNEKTKYLMHATHQLKAPFAAIQSYTDLILDGYTGNIPEQTHDIILKIKDRCVLLSNSIKEMLELANLKSMVRENIQMEPESLNKMIISSINHLKEFAASQDIGIQYEPLPDTLSVRCNRNQILILLSNLIENAISYSPPHTSISINTGQFTPTQIRISVSDKGIGIAKQFQHKIFEEYFRTNEAVAFNDKSTGLGLAIVREIADIHHIFVEVESTPLKGSTFFFVMNLV